MAPAAYQKAAGNKEFSNISVLIIGSGFSGLCAAVNLLQRNIKNFVIVEKSAGLGGTWRDNKYPGCCCDVYSHLYSYSFAQNAGWSRLYPNQEEILDYLHAVAAKYGLNRYIRFSSYVDESHWDDDERKWKTSIKVIGAKDAEFGQEYTVSSDFLISAVGQLNYPQYPSIEGLDDFGGKMMHSARWDWSYDLKGKKIGVIGNGATAAQIIPEIAPEASHLTVFQRTPNWVIPRVDLAIWKPFRALFSFVPPVLWRFRAMIMDFREAFYTGITNPDSRQSNLARNTSVAMMKRQLPQHPELWDKLTPNYPPGCKRIIISDDYFPTLARDNVTLETGHIDRITERGVVVGGTEHDFDLLVCATGFRAVEFMHPIEIYGAKGKPLSEVWNQGGRALYGVAVESMPNFGMMYGPNTNLGHNSIILMVEAQMRYMVRLIETVVRARAQGDSLAVTPKVERVIAFNEELQRVLSSTSFAHPNCNSWYKTDEGLITNNWSGTVVDYQKMLSKVKWDDFVIEGTGQAVPKTGKRGAVQNIGRVREETIFGLKSCVAAAGLMGVLGTMAMRAPHMLPQFR